MPLSDREQHLLEQMEQALYAEDPKFATHMRGVASGRARRQYVLAAIAVLAGLALVLVAVNARLIWLGAIGFLIMVAGGWLAVAPRRTAKPGLTVVGGTAAPRSGPAAAGRSTGSGKAPLLKRLEDRWERRRDEQ